jgi:hypothetical protein
MRFGIGQPVTRKEDARFLTGRSAMSRTSMRRRLARIRIQGLCGIVTNIAGVV